MRILFVVSGNRNEISPIVSNQANAIMKYSKEINIEYYEIKGKGLIGYFKNFLTLKKKVKIFQPQIIHAHYSLTGMLAALAVFPKRIIVSLMGSDTFEKGAKLAMVRLFTAFIWEIIIVKSERMKKNIQSKKIIVLPNGVDFYHFQPLSKTECQNKIQYNPDKKHILFFLDDPDRKEKNLFLAQAAVDLLNNPDIEFHIIPTIDHSLVPIYLNAADLLLLTSFYEGSPNIVKEAMACNIPIVSTIVGDVDIVIKNTSGCYLAAFEARDVACKISLALQHNGRTNGREKITHLDSNEISRKIIDIYHTLLK